MPHYVEISKLRELRYHILWRNVKDERAWWRWRRCRRGKRRWSKTVQQHRYGKLSLKSLSEGSRDLISLIVNRLPSSARHKRKFRQSVKNMNLRLKTEDYVVLNQVWWTERIFSLLVSSLLKLWSSTGVKLDLCLVILVDTKKTRKKQYKTNKQSRKRPKSW